MAPWLHRIDPIALQFPEFTVFGATLHPAVHWYGIMYLLAFAAAWWLGRSRVRAGRLPGVDEAAFGDLVFYGMLGVILGGRLGYILFYDLPVYLHDPLQALKIWEGGMSFHGGLIGVCVLMEERLRSGDAEGAAIAGIEAASDLLARHFPRQPGDIDENELPDLPHLS